MKRTTLVLLVAASTATLLLVGAAAKAGGIEQPSPHAIASWLAAIFAFSAVVVMFAEHFVHACQPHLYLAGTFLALGMMGTWDALTFPSAGSIRGPLWRHLALWQFQWITLAAVLIVLIWSAVISSGKSTSKSACPTSADTATVVSAALLWASLLIFLVSHWHTLSGLFALAKLGMYTSIVCSIVFLAGCIILSRPFFHKDNTVLVWTAYGLIFGALSQAAMGFQSNPSPALFGFAGLMKVLMFVAPLAGMLAEHTHGETRMRDQSAELENIIEAQEALSGICTPEELYRRMVELAAEILAPAVVCFMSFEKESNLLRVVAHTGLDDETAKQLVFRPGEGPPGDSFSERRTIFLRDVSDSSSLLQKLGDQSGFRSAVFVPLTVRNECLGVLALFFPKRSVQKLSTDQLRVLETLARQATLVLETLRMRNQVRDYTKTTDEYAREMDIVWDIAQAVASELELNALVDTLTEKLRHSVGATAASVLIFDPDSTGMRILGHRRVKQRHELSGHTDVCDEIAATVARTGEPFSQNDLPNSPHCKYPQMARDDGVHHVLSVPMSLRGFTGAITVFRQNAEPFSEREKRLLTRLAPMVAAGVRNADLYEREKRIADELQTSLLPAVERHYAGIQVAAIHQAAYDESLVGGDFYDVIDFGDGLYGVAVGDVSGKGLDAAVYTAMTRYMIQAYSAENSDPLSVIRKLNAALYRYTPPGKFVTLVYGVIDVKKQSFTYANAGQEPPLYYRKADASLELLSSTGPAVGAVADGEYVVDSVSFEPGDILVLYTDGATEARTDGKFLGTEALKNIVTENIEKEDFDRLPQAILSGVRSYAKGRLRDDIAILAVKSRTPGALF